MIEPLKTLTDFGLLEFFSIFHIYFNLADLFRSIVEIMWTFLIIVLLLVEGHTTVVAKKEQQQERSLRNHKHSSSSSSKSSSKSKKSSSSSQQTVGSGESFLTSSVSGLISKTNRLPANYTPTKVTLPVNVWK